MRTSLLKSLPLCIGLAFTTHGVPAHAQHDHSTPNPAAMAPLVEKVRNATARYMDIKVAAKDGWVQATPCVSSPSAGAMGVHYVLPSRVGDGTINASEPEALIYEPQPNGALRLVGVEYIVTFDAWHKTHELNDPPILDGQLLNLVEEPNRFGLPRFYELHAWAWRDNPNGTFVDWNPLVSCDQR